MSPEQQSLLDKVRRKLVETENLSADDQLRGLIAKGLIDERGQPIEECSGRHESNGHSSATRAKQ